jgi:uncharacterized protein (TIGR03437 family)
MARYWPILRQLFVAALGAATALAQTSTNITLNLNFNDSSSPGLILTNWLVLTQSGFVGPLGNATLVSTSSTMPNPNLTSQSPSRITLTLAFNEADAITISYTESDHDFYVPQTFTMSGGTITGGTGAYAGATGSIDLSVVKDGNTPFATATTTGSGNLSIVGHATSLTLSNFRGVVGPNDTGTVTSDSVNLNVNGSLGSATGTLLADYYLDDEITIGSATVVFNGTDSLNLWFAFNTESTTSGAPAGGSFSGNISGGTGKYATASGTLTFTSTGSGFRATGSMTMAPSDTPVITQVKTAYGLPRIAYNTWLQINGKNLVPANTPSSGVDWSNAPDFATGQMPTQLGPISVSFYGGGMVRQGFVYWYCSAATNPNCTSGDQINVLAPLLGQGDSGPTLVTVTNNGVSSAPFTVFRSGLSPVFFIFDTTGHVAARHLNSSFVGPSGLYPGFSTPAKVGETISMYGSGFGKPTNNTVVSGSATQTGSLYLDGQGLSCWISGRLAHTVGALVSPGLYQFNITIPSGVASGDNPVNCVYGYSTTFPGALIAVQ